MSIFLDLDLDPSTRGMISSELLAATPRKDCLDLVDDAQLLWAVGAAASVEVMTAILDLGVAPDGVPGAIPLAMIDYTQPCALDLAQLLLARGANPNKVYPKGARVLEESSPMHAACQSQAALRLLVAHGGDVHLRCPHGRSLFDIWIQKTLYQKRKIGCALEALQFLVDSGLSPRMLTVQKQPFLSACWASPGLRKNLPRLFEMGFDARQRGEGTPMRSRSLLEVARLKKDKGVNGALPGALLAHFEAAELEEAAPASAPTHRRNTPRL